jgi:3-(3-hydroxy-phenyl)propionate hydroxylase
MHDPTWVSHFGDAIRQADQYRVGRVFLAGDAAHIHLPAGGQGMNMGIQDAFNLGWKLVAVQRGDAPDSLLDTYHSERHAADGETLKVIRAQSVLVEPGPRADDLHEVVTRLVGFGDVNNYLATVQSGLATRYSMAGEHLLLGRRVPDVDIATPSGAKRVCELLKAAHPVLLDFSTSGALLSVEASWAGRIETVAARCLSESWEISGQGSVPAPSALLIRPDGYVAWVDDGAHDLPALRDSLTTWCGPGTDA